VTKHDDQPAASRRRRGEEHLIAGLRAEIARLRDGLERVDETLVSLERERAAPGARKRPDRYYEVLLDVYERGRHGADGDTFGQLGRRRGYDARGLGGFFVGSRAPLRREDGRVVLTGEGHRVLSAYLDDAP
jgi:hypothetical protein